ncbi:RebB family R body protein [Pseudoalteromonas denitrificans]|uniref:Killing trait domain-containing protein n=1 Tax=Pseudoalteromonas denitrificans DSM 6059 TaxID=1123010 RepID=A0A1I1SZ59_9GAMM|nr:RebB family R body protein [Pseudoalteromonas denitrificans]SFD51652.1 Killing trait domain-containing protein [Pseudoalteromonas denitrificans DSM 6059]
MATKTVNEKITDSVTQVNTKALGDVPAMAMGNLYSAMGLALSNASLNAASSQQQAGITIQAATVQGVNSLGAIGSAVLGRAAEGIVEKD